MIEKNTIHKFETTDVAVELTEYPHRPGEAFYLNIKPRDRFERVDIGGAPDGEQSLVISIGSFMGSVSSEGLVDQLEKALKQYRKGWRELRKMSL